MVSLFTFTAPPGPCGYLPDRVWSLQYEVVSSMNAAEYASRMLAGWRRFGYSLFQPQCPTCHACQSLRIPITTFQPNESQRRAMKKNRRDLRLTIAKPTVSNDTLDLYDRFHAFQTDTKGWPEHAPKSADDFAESFVHHPFPTEEWRYHLGDRLVGVGYVDALPVGLSAIYFFYDPTERSRSLGTFNVLKVIEETRRRKLPHAYLGYYVAGCRSLEYKATFRPNEVLGPDGQWSGEHRA